MYQIPFYYQSDKTIEPPFLKILVKVLKSIVFNSLCRLWRRRESKSLFSLNFLFTRVKLNRFLLFWRCIQKLFMSTHKTSWISKILYLNYTLEKLISVLNNDKEFVLMTLYTPLSKFDVLCCWSVFCSRTFIFLI